MSGFVNGIKEIAKEYSHLKGFVSIPMGGNTREITKEFIESFKRQGVVLDTFDIEEKFHTYMQIVNPVFYESNKQEFSSFVEGFVEKDFLFEVLNFKPDFIFAFSNAFLNKRTLEVAKKLGIKVVLYHPKDYSNEDEVEVAELLKQSTTLLVPSGFKKSSLQFEHDFAVKELETACDIHKYSPKDESKPYYVTIFGDVSLYRVTVANNLVKNGVNVSIFGSGWKEYGYLPDHLKECIIEDSEFIESSKWSEIFRKSKYVLALPFDVKRDGSVSAKLNYLAYAAAGCGSLMIGYSKDPSLQSFTHSENIMLFETDEEIKSIITSLDENEEMRQYIGLSAVEAIRTNHTTSKRVEELLDFISK